MSYMQFDAVIIGAGISGLSAAYFLKQKGLSCLVLEKSDLPGGVIRSEKKNGFLFEYGPNSTLSGKESVFRLINDLGMQDEQMFAADHAKYRYIVKNGELQALPTSPPGFIKTPLFSFKTKLGLLKEPFIKPAPADSLETLADFVKRRLGNEFLDYAIDPFVAGVYAGKPETLIVKNAFKRLHQLEQNHGSLIRGAIRLAKERKNKVQAGPSGKIFSFRNGMQSLTDKLAQSFDGALKTGCNIKSIEYKKNHYEIVFENKDGQQKAESKVVITTLPSHAFEQLPLNIDKEDLTKIKEIPYARVAMVYYGYKEKPAGVQANGFGFLVPAKEKRQILGTLWNSSIFSGRAPENGLALSTFVGGSRQPDLPDKSDSQLMDLVNSELKDLMNISASPDFVKIVRWEKAIPQYTIKQNDALQAIKNIEDKNPGLFISGNFRGGISVSDCIENADFLSDKAAEFIKNN